MQEEISNCECSSGWIVDDPGQLDMNTVARHRIKPTRRNANIRALIRRLRCYLGYILRYVRIMQQGINPRLRCHIAFLQLSARLAGDYSCFGRYWYNNVNPDQGPARINEKNASTAQIQCHLEPVSTQGEQARKSLSWEKPKRLACSSIRQVVHLGHGLQDSWHHYQDFRCR
jgi:hypothetical protein